MKEKQIHTILRDLTEQKAPRAEIDLWPRIESRVQAGELPEMRGTQMNTHPQRFSRLAGAITLVAILASALIFTTPQGQAFAQTVLRFFIRTESNQLPLQDFQLTPRPTPGTRTPDPASSIDANSSIDDVQQKAGYKVYQPSWIPDNLKFSGASIEQDQKIVRIFYTLSLTNGMGIRQEPVGTSHDCKLCDKVGADAAIQKVSIAGVYGEYVEGVWKLTEQGPVWESDPYLKTMRWQDKDMAFELMFMGPPDRLSKEDMIAIAESMK